MDAITQSEREAEKNYKSPNRRGKRAKQKQRERKKERRAINWHLACVFGRQKIFLIPHSSFLLYGFASRGFWLSRVRWFPHPLLLRR